MNTKRVQEGLRGLHQKYGRPGTKGFRLSDSLIAFIPAILLICRYAASIRRLIRAIRRGRVPLSHKG